MNYTIISEIIQRALVIIFLLFITYILAYTAKTFFNKKINLTKYNFLKHLLVGAIYFFGVLFTLTTIPIFKNLSISLLASSGIVLTVLGLAAQDVLSNIISGVFLDLFQTIKIGDKISVNNYTGIIDDITLRHTVLKTIDNKIILIPNSTLNTSIIQKLS